MRGGLAVDGLNCLRVVLVLADLVRVRVRHRVRVRVRSELS